MKTYFLFLRFVFWAVTLFLLTGCANIPDTGKQNADSIPTGSVGVVETQDIMIWGKLSADKIETLQWQTSGIIAEVNVKPGDVVKKGDQLAILDEDSLDVFKKSDVILAKKNIIEYERIQSIYLEYAQLIVEGLRKKSESTEIYYKTLEYPKETTAYLEKLHKELVDLEAEELRAHQRYKKIIDDHAEYWKIIQAEDEWQYIKKKYDELVSKYNFLTAKPTEEEILSAKIKLDLVRANLKDAREIRDRMKQGDFSNISNLYNYSNVLNYQIVSYYELPELNDWGMDEKKVLESIKLVAPFDGKIVDVLSVKGDMASYGYSPIRIVDPESIIILAVVPERSLTTIHVGDSASVELVNFENVRLTGIVIEKSEYSNGEPFLRNSDFQLKIKITQKDFPFLIGSSAKIKIHVDTAIQELSIPADALLKNEDGDFVKLVGKDKGVYNMPVTVMEKLGDTYIILDDGRLVEGDTLQLFPAD